MLLTNNYWLFSSPANNVQHKTLVTFGGKSSSVNGNHENKTPSTHNTRTLTPDGLKKRPFLPKTNKKKVLEWLVKRP